MTYTQAQNLLDQRRAGAEIPEPVITRALELTGDIPAEFCAADALRELESV